MPHVDPARSRLMSRVRQQGTDPEIFVRSVLWSMGGRYRVNDRSLPGSPDISNKTRRKVVFVHGCFWHAHQGCRRATLPKRNRRFWQAKFEANRERDRRKEYRLREMGFDILVIWECELERDWLEGTLRLFWFGEDR